MSYRGKVWCILAVLLGAFWFLAYQANELVMNLLALVLKLLKCVCQEFDSNLSCKEICID